MVTRTVKAIDLVKQYLSAKKEINSAIERVLNSGWYVLGTEVENFEKEFAEYIGAKYAVGVASGTDALTIALKVLGLGKSDGIIIPANIYPSSFGVARAEVEIQLADIDPATLNISLTSIKKAVSRKTKAILAVHLYGNPVDLTPIKSFAKANGLYLIEDCAQAIGAEYKGKKVGTFGDISCFSFYPTKNLGAVGDAGAIITNKTKYAQTARLWRMYGEKGRYKSELIGLNSRLDEIQAAILRVKLRKLNEWNKKRRKLADIYKKYLTNCDIKLLKETPQGMSCYHLFVVRAKNRDSLQKYLQENGIVSGIHYPIPIHLTKSFAFLGYKIGEFPQVEKASQEILSLPLYPEMSIKDIKYVCNCLCGFVS
jgi:dTDP-4-amino-4,6-dideoxygalactose transaminase